VDDQIVAIYCLCDDVLKALDHAEDPQRQMGDAEVMTTAIVAALHFHGHWQRAQAYLRACQEINVTIHQSLVE
jgi:hypothetical protein